MPLCVQLYVNSIGHGDDALSRYRSVVLVSQGFLGCCALVTQTINKSCTGRHEMHMDLLARFQSGRGRESYSHKLLTVLAPALFCPAFLFLSPVTMLCCEARLEKPAFNCYVLMYLSNRNNYVQIIQ